MNKQQLIDKIAEETGFTKDMTEKFVNSFQSCVMKTVRKGDNVRLLDFGTFDKHKAKERVGRNPQTGEKIMIPAAWRPKFKAHTVFKEMIK